MLGREYIRKCVFNVARLKSVKNLKIKRFKVIYDEFFWGGELFNLSGI
jgi:hypothetical protein